MFTPAPLGPSEAFSKSLQTELNSVKQELTTRNEFCGLLQNKNRVLEQDSMERKQLAKEVESLRAAAVLNAKEQNSLNTQIDELGARLYSHYAQIPTEALDAWLEPLARVGFGGFDT